MRDQFIVIRKSRAHTGTGYVRRYTIICFPAQTQKRLPTSNMDMVPFAGDPLQLGV